MKKTDAPISFVQMEENKWYAAYSFMAIAGAVPVGVGLFEILRHRYIGIAALAVGVIVVLFGISMILCFLRRIEIAQDEVRLMLGRRTLKRIAHSQIKTLISGAVQPNGGRWREWKPEIIVLSTQTPEHIQSVGKIAIQSADEFHLQYSPVASGKGDIAELVDAYVNSKMTAMHLEEGEGIWLEYTPERAEKLSRLFPHAVNLTRR